MNTVNKKLFAAAVVAAGFSPVGFAVESIGEALKEGDVNINFRLRFEEVDVDGNDDVDLTSLRTRLTYKTADVKGASALVEMDDVTHLSDFEGGVADPEGTEVNQAYLAYTVAGSTIKYGRQRILLDNQRFVGGVGFRQNEQTYDAVSVTNKSIADTTLFVANVNNVNRIFGEDVASGDHENDTWLLNAQYAGLNAGTLTAYAYLIDNQDAISFSSDTYGVRFVGKTMNGDLNYTLEYATQADAADNPSDYDADYYLLTGSYKMASVTLEGGYEVLGADGSDGQFITPLATLHKFQGWNDKFLGGGTGNVPGGIQDLYVSAATHFNGVKLSLVYHQLSSDDSDVNNIDNYGSEYGFLVAKKLGPVGLSLKYCDFNADSDAAAAGFTDSSKIWLTAQANF